MGSVAAAEAAIRPSVLVVDDEREVLHAIEDTLEGEYRVYAEASPVAAIELLKELPDLSVILADQRMPKMRGDEFLTKAEEMSPATRVLITAYADLGAVTRAVNNGHIFCYVSKPWSAEQLRLVVHKAAEHYRLLKELAHERELLRDLMDNVPDAIYFLDNQHRYLRVNKPHAAWLNVSRPEDAVGKTYEDFFPPDRVQSIREENARVYLNGGAVTDHLQCYTSATGEVTWFSTTKAPFRDQSGRIAGLVGISRDVTERRRDEETIRLLLEISREVSAAPDEEAALEIVLGKLCEAVGWPYGEAWVPDASGARLVQSRVWYGDRQRFSPFREGAAALSFASGEGLPGKVRSSRRPLSLSNTQLDDPAFFKRPEAARQAGFNEALGVPIPRGKDDAFAVLVFLHHSSRQVSERAVEIVTAVAAQLSEIFERQQAHHALRESEERFRQIAENIREVFFLTDPGTRQSLYVSPAFEHVFGLSRESQYANPLAWSAAIHPDDRDRVLAEYRQDMQTGDIDITYRIVRPDGALRWVRARGFPVRDAVGTLIRIAGIVEDITESTIQQEKIVRLSRVQAVMSGINSTIVRVRDRDELFREACRIAVEAGGFRLAWLGVVDRGEAKLRPVARAGADAKAFLDNAPAEVWEIGPENRSLSAQAIWKKEAVIVNDVQDHPRVWMKNECLQRGIHSLVVLPLLVQGEGVGTLSLYAGEPGFFDEEEMRLLTELAGDISFAVDHLEKEERLNYLAYYDSLTGLANSTLFHERLVQFTDGANRERSRLALLVADVDRFRTINDTLGRQAGDELLKQITERFQAARGEPGQYARIGSNRFAIIIPGVASDEEVARRVERRQKAIFGPPFQLGGTELRVSAKVGIALYPSDGADADTLLRNAEAALAKAKAGGERYLFYTQKLTERIAEKLTLENKLRQALEQDEFVLHYQPKVNMDTRRIEGVEALIRWQSPELGLVPPMQFIPLMEETGLILEAGVWAMRQAVLDHQRWLDEGLSAPRIAVNVSPIQLRQRDFVETVRKALAAGTAAAGIDLEITESLIMHDIEENIEKLKAVRDLGVNIAIDDFGTGYSSLGYLARLPVQSLKIDRLFIDTMQADPDNMSLVSTIISLAHAFRLTVVAEGVETEEQAKVLRLLRCDQMQGYLISRPLPFEAMTALLKQDKQ